MNHEVNPNHYERRYDGDGVYYDPKPEYTAELEKNVSQGATDEREAYARAVDKKRRERRTLAMNESETRMALAKAKEIAEALQNAAAE